MERGHHTDAVAQLKADAVLLFTASHGHLTAGQFEQSDKHVYHTRHIVRWFR